MKKFYITTPIYYPNARPHVGSAYTTIVCDVIARYKRMCGYDVAFLTGTDEHGEKLQRAADETGIPVARFVAEKRELFKELWRTLGIPQHSPEHPAGYRFVHTSQNPAHVKSVHWMIQQANKAGYIEKKKYEGRYCVWDERYVSDGPEPTKCDICGRPAELISEENYFFKLSAFQDRLLKLYDEHPEFVQPDFRRNEVVSFVRSGLRDISISRRRLKWGIPWPGDDEQVVYVWYDALTSYLTGIGFEGERRSKDFEKYWMGAEGPTEVVHMIGKDILRFHAVYWPAFLMAAGLPLPKTIFAHGWIYYEQDKMSKSKGNVVYPEPIVKAFEEFGAPGNDALRYYLLREAPFGHDTSFSYEALIKRYNSDLANDLGNLANRTITMVNRYLEGRFTAEATEPAALEGELKAEFFGDEYPGGPGETTATSGYVGSYVGNFDRFHLQPVVGRIWEAISALNGYLVKRHPWEPNESAQEAHPASRALVLYTTADLLRAITVLLCPIMPHSAERLWAQLGCKGELPKQNPRNLAWGQLEGGTTVGKPKPIFPRLDKAKALAKLEELAEADRERSEPKGVQVSVPSEELLAVSSQQQSVLQTDSSSPAAQNDSPPTAVGSTIDNRPSTIPKITIDDFARVEMVVAQIVAAEPVPGAKKLLKLQVDIGRETRQICAGIAEYYQPEELQGRKIVLVVNLEPRKLRGVESNGMLLAATGPDGRPILATFNEDVPNGTRLK